MAILISLLVKDTYIVPTVQLQIQPLITYGVLAIMRELHVQFNIVRHREEHGVHY